MKITIERKKNGWTISIPMPGLSISWYEFIARDREEVMNILNREVKERLAEIIKQEESGGKL